MSRWAFLKGSEDEIASGPSPEASNGASTLRLTPTHGSDWRVRTVVHDGERITDLKNWGFRTAGSANASPEVLKTVIGWIFHNRVTIADAHEESERTRLEQLAQDILQKEGELAKARHLEEEGKQAIGRERDKLAEKKAELAAVRAGDSSLIDAHGLSDRMSFYIAAGTLLVLTLYLFLFYVSAIYNAFIFDAAKAAEEGLKTGRELSVTIFNGAAFQKAWSSGMMTFLFIWSAPSIVVGLGFLIHHFSRLGKRLNIVAIVGVTFFFDLLLAYEIVNQIHRIKVLTGETQVEFSLGVLAKTPEFYIILLAGFVVYIIWGLILQAVLEGLEKFRPERVATKKLLHAVGACEQAIAEREEANRVVGREVVRLTSELKVLESQRSPRELRNNEFRRHLDEMMQGWLTYIGQAFPGERLEREAEAQRVRSETAALLMK